MNKANSFHDASRFFLRLSERVFSGKFDQNRWRKSEQSTYDINLKCAPQSDDEASENWIKTIHPQKEWHSV